MRARQRGFRSSLPKTPRTGTGNWLEGERFSSGASEETVQEWVESLDLRQ